MNKSFGIVNSGSNNKLAVGVQYAAIAIRLKTANFRAIQLWPKSFSFVGKTNNAPFAWGIIKNPTIANVSFVDAPDTGAQWLDGKKMHTVTGGSFIQAGVAYSRASLSTELVGAAIENAVIDDDTVIALVVRPFTKTVILAGVCWEERTFKVDA